MSDAEPNGAAGGEPLPPAGPIASAHNTRFSAIWLIPIVALVVAAFLGWQTVSKRGPLITIEFDNADGLTAGQTVVKHKNVALGTVESVRLSDDFKVVLVHVRMTREATRILTDHTRFWVVRPRLSGASISGLETLVSGAYIAIDPGPINGPKATFFKGLEGPPGVRSDEPGRTYTLMTSSSIYVGEGSPVIFRGTDVGEVLGYTMPPLGRGPIPIQIFVHEPYDHYIRTDTRFWNASGIEATFGGGGLHVQIASLQAAISGAIGFGLPVQRREDQSVPEAPGEAVFKLYDTESDANSASYHRRLPFVTYLHDSVAGLTVGSKVVMFGIQIGEVTDIALQLDRETGTARVRVAMAIQPERAFPDAGPGETPDKVAASLVANGLRAQLASESFITGASDIAFQFVPNAPAATIGHEGAAIVLPSQAGGLSGIESSLADVAAKLDALPLTSIASHLDGVLAGADRTVNSADVRDAVHQLSGTLRSIHDLAEHANRGMTPVLQRLPAIADQLESTLRHADGVLASYGGGSDFQTNLQGVLDQVRETLRSLRLLADYLDRHPNALVFGRSPPSQPRR